MTFTVYKLSKFKIIGIFSRVFESVPVLLSYYTGEKRKKKKTFIFFTLLSRKSVKVYPMHRMRTSYKSRIDKLFL